MNSVDMLGFVVMLTALCDGFYLACLFTIISTELEPFGEIHEFFSAETADLY